MPANARPVMPADHASQPTRWKGATKAERRAWSKKHQAKAVRVWSPPTCGTAGQGHRNADKHFMHATYGRYRGAWRGERGRTIGFDCEPESGCVRLSAGLLTASMPDGWSIGQGGRRAVRNLRTASPRIYDSSSMDARLAPHSPYRWPAAISIGTKPTFNEATGMYGRVVEAYAITDDWLDLVIRCVWNSPDSASADQFASADDLAAELRRNVEETKRLTA